MCSGEVFKQVDMRAVGRNNRGAAIGHGVKYFALGTRDIGFRIKMLDMRSPDMRYDRAMRSHHAHQRIDFAGMVHADFKNGICTILRHARQTERHANMIVEGFFRRECFA